MESDGPRAVRRPGIDLGMFIDPEPALRVHTDGSTVRIRRRRRGSRNCWVPRARRKAKSTTGTRNVAFAVQDTCEAAMITLFAWRWSGRSSRNLCLAGGVALNSKANGKILASGLVDNLFIQPAAADDGVGLGAALAPYLDGGGRLPVRRMRHAYLGPEIPTTTRSRKALETYKIRYTRAERCGGNRCRIACRRENRRLVSRAAWNSARARLVAGRYWPIRAIRR